MYCSLVTYPFKFQNLQKIYTIKDETSLYVVLIYNDIYHVVYCKEHTVFNLPISTYCSPSCINVTILMCSEQYVVYWCNPDVHSQLHYELTWITVNLDARHSFKGGHQTLLNKTREVGSIDFKETVYVTADSSI